jgi:homotetrameric cytidine deaminase
LADSLVEQARAVQAKAYAPYSQYRVGAALEADDGRVFLGCNVENVSFGLTICAERAAVARAVAEGALSFRRVTIVTDSEPPAPPCGACRQVLFEFSPGLIVESVGPTSRQRWSIQELLPAAFSKGSLA